MSEGDYQRYLVPGLRLTRTRRHVIDVLQCSTQTHGLTVADIHAALLRGGQPVAQATFYRIIGQMQRQGFVDRYFGGGQDKARFRLRDGSQPPWNVCVINGVGQMQVLCNRTLFEALAEAVAPLGFALVPGQTVTVRVD